MKKFLGKSVLFVVAFALLFATFAPGASAHGYISKPESRAYLAKLGINQNAGAIQWEPQSVEATGNFPLGGPSDGTIAGGGGGKFPEMDAQTPDRWHHIDLLGGQNNFTWTLTALHRTKEYKYYITKKGWNPNSLLTRGDLELLTTIDAHNEVPTSTTVNHQVPLPTDRNGYYVVLGVWEIADTGNAFYQAVDVNLINNGTMTLK
ncbi:chitin-binding protein [Listeria sp. SHR_NRA_18]|uniref:lytic polysaccharide monooxygenase n=1 Tax=Listeria sp. SHR_NRA_18 TaxID=2269046 RepID=UPI000F603688|nr:lytic polysaccharide monooxygenase [Listeria sp. SHR_NRA_18]RQW67727.1 chitin-binding protein [Listeria sp. SHR_NRA_18]